MSLLCVCARVISPSTAPPLCAAVVVLFWGDAKISFRFSPLLMMRYQMSIVATVWRACAQQSAAAAVRLQVDDINMVVVFIMPCRVLFARCSKSTCGPCAYLAGLVVSGISFFFAGSVTREVIVVCRLNCSSTPGLNVCVCSLQLAEQVLCAELLS